MARKKWCKYCKKYQPAILFDRKDKYNLVGLCSDCRAKLEKRKEKHKKSEELKALEMLVNNVFK